MKLFDYVFILPSSLLAYYNKQKKKVEGIIITLKP